MTYVIDPTIWFQGNSEDQEDKVEQDWKKKFMKSVLIIFYWFTKSGILHHKKVVNRIYSERSSYSSFALLMACITSRKDLFN